MNSKRIMIALTLALLVSGSCTWFVSHKMNGRPQAQQQPKISYAAPSRPLEAGEVLRPENVELIPWPASDAIEGAFTRVADLVGRETLFPLAKGGPILDRDLSARGSGVGLAGKIPDGMRAVALRSDEVVGVAGFLVPGSHLDVLVTYRPDRFPEPVTATVLQNAVVIAAGNRIEPDPEGKPSAVTVVTLLLTPEQSQRAVLASTQGNIHFILRNGADSSQTHDTPLLLSQLSGVPPAAATTFSVPQSPTAKRTAAPRQTEIETILGGATSTTPQDGVPRQ